MRLKILDKVGWTIVALSRAAPGRRIALSVPDRNVLRLAELATIDDLACRLEGDFRHLAGADGVPQRGRPAINDLYVSIF